MKKMLEMPCFVFCDFWVGNPGFCDIWNKNVVFNLVFIIKYILASFPSYCSLCSNEADLC